MTASNHPPLERAQAAELLQVALEEARIGLAEGGIPIGGALFHRDGTLLGETDAFRNAGRRRDYADTVMVTTLSPCWYCSGLVRQFGIGAVVMGESENFSGGHDWLAENGVEVVDLADPECIELLSDFISSHHDLWFEDIGL